MGLMAMGLCAIAGAAATGLLMDPSLGAAADPKWSEWAMGMPWPALALPMFLGHAAGEVLGRYGDGRT